MPTNEQPQSADEVKAIVDDHDIRFIRFWFTDILGQLKSFSINKEELDDAFEGGMGFDGSSITGFNAIEESDMIAMPDASTFKILPWRPGRAASAASSATSSRRTGSPTRATRATSCGAHWSGRRRWASTPST
jgi:glutamine synthetase